MLTPQQIAQKWSRNLAGSTESIKAGVQAVTTSPTELAARSVDRQVAGVQAAAASGRTAAALRKVDLSTWQQKILNKGLARIAQGAQQAVGDVERFQTAWAPVMESARQQARQIPRDGGAGSLERVRVVMEAGRRFAGKS